MTWNVHRRVPRSILSKWGVIYIYETLRVRGIPNQIITTVVKLAGGHCLIDPGWRKERSRDTVTWFPEKKKSSWSCSSSMSWVKSKVLAPVPDMNCLSFFATKLCRDAKFANRWSRIAGGYSELCDIHPRKLMGLHPPPPVERWRFQHYVRPYFRDFNHPSKSTLQRSKLAPFTSE